ncbi:MAG TPA: HDIG domain-containing protein [Tepidisphaeraceae bacterium]|nr:HDIG domain-containing protein [Tepidisphaeraceae bacterium]
MESRRVACPGWTWKKLQAAGIPASLGIAAVFFIASSAILMLRQEMVPYRPGQAVPYDIVSRVTFNYPDKNLYEQRKREAADAAPRVYTPTGTAWGDIDRALLQLPDRLPEFPSQPLPEDLRNVFDPGAVTALETFLSSEGRDAWAHRVNAYITSVRNYRISQNGANVVPIIVLPEAERWFDVKMEHPVRVGQQVVDSDLTFPNHLDTDPDPNRDLQHKEASFKYDELRDILRNLAKDQFRLALQPAIADFTLAQLANEPTDTLNDLLTTQAKNAAMDAVPPSAGDVLFVKGLPLVVKNPNRPDQLFTTDDWLLLRAENHAYLNSVKGFVLQSRLGEIGFCLLATIVLSAYLARVQPRVIRNHARAGAICLLLLSMLLLTQLSGISNSSLYLLGLAPTVLAAVILAIAYDARMAIAVASIEGMLATCALNEGIAFFLIMFVGSVTCCFLLDDIRSRSKLIEVGGVTALAMAAATAAASMLALDPPWLVLYNCAYAAAAGLGVGFVVLGILPFVEKAFRITTSMTLLELADVSQSLLRRLATEAPGTYNHSLQVATIAEAAADAIKANPLLCRVASYYHDVGKIQKAEYFIENQTGGENRHLNLNPSVSRMIIIGHVKYGVDLAREHNLPTSIISFIQQHHGTTLVEYFFHQARQRETKETGEEAQVSEYEYRYPGPRPRTREIAVVMLADAVESACRAMQEPTAARVETLVHELAMKRLLDGQFGECDLTMRDLETMERSMVKTVLSIYHGRIAYPSMATLTGVPLLPASAASAAKTA